TAPPQRSPLVHHATIAALSLSLVLIGFLLEKRGVLRTLDLPAYDLLVAFQRPELPSSEIINIDFDESSVRRYNAFPIPRLLLADVITKLAAGKTSVIGVDIILDLPRKPEDDATLARAIDNAGNVVLISEYGFGAHEGNDPLPAFQKAAAGVAFGDLPLDEDGAVRRMFLRVTTDTYKSLSLPVAIADLASDQHLRPGGSNYLLFGQH